MKDMYIMYTSKNCVQASVSASVGVNHSKKVNNTYMYILLLYDIYVQT